MQSMSAAAAGITCQDLQLQHAGWLNLAEVCTVSLQQSTQFQAMQSPKKVNQVKHPGRQGQTALHVFATAGLLMLYMGQAWVTTDLSRPTSRC